MSNGFLWPPLGEARFIEGTVRRADVGIGPYTHV